MTSGDFSWLALFLAGLVTVAQAYTQPKGDPSGNSILTPGLNQAVPVGKPFDITWVPTTTGTITLLLLHGESTDMKPMYPIVEKLPNLGKYTWTPKTDIAPEKTHYGIQLICDDNGQYQWSTQFGISNPSFSGSESGTTSSSSIHISASTSESISATSISSTLPGTLKPTLTASTGFSMHNSSIIHPSGTISASTTIKTTTTGKPSTISGAPTSTTRSTTSSSSTTDVSTQSEAMAAMYTAAGGVVALAAAAVFAL